MNIQQRCYGHQPAQSQFEDLVRTQREYWQAYCYLKAHVKALSKAILKDNKSGATALAIMTEGILEQLP
jgi:hypothetical protein